MTRRIMHDPKALALFQEILKKTQAGKFPWQTTASPNQLVATMLGKYTLTLFPYTTVDEYGETQGPPSISVDNDKGTTVVEINNQIDGIEADQLQAVAVLGRR